jgi:hypothetical protein
MCLYPTNKLQTVTQNSAFYLLTVIHAYVQLPHIRICPTAQHLSHTPIYSIYSELTVQARLHNSPYYTLLHTLTSRPTPFFQRISAHSSSLYLLCTFFFLHILQWGHFQIKERATSELNSLAFKLAASNGASDKFVFFFFLFIDCLNTSYILHIIDIVSNTSQLCNRYPLKIIFL